MFRMIWLLVTTTVRCFSVRRAALLENPVLRQQLAVPKRKHPRSRLALVLDGAQFYIQLRRSGLVCIARYIFGIVSHTRYALAISVMEGFEAPAVGIKAASST